VIIPSFNKSKYIRKTLESIVNQDYSNLEIVIQDGGSTDGTLEIIKYFAKNYSKKIIWESDSDGGQLNAINRGFSKATGDILTFINADDFYIGDAFKVIVKASIDNPKALWFAGKGRVVDQNGAEIVKPVRWYKNLFLCFSNYNLLLINNYLMQPSVFVTKEAYKRFGPFTGNSDFVTEYDMWLKIGKCKMPVVIDKDISGFRIESGTKTSNLSDKLLNEDLKIVKKYTNNQVILLLHRINNLGRRLVKKLV
jgi:glycosyltransferase involved in cell wall biosynthesis